MRKIIGSLCFLLVASSWFSFNQSIAHANDDITGITLEIEMRDIIDRGIMQGYDEGEYRPDEEVTRGQFATLLSRALELPAGTSSFPDVPQTSKLFAGINSASKAGIINGYGDGRFGMNDPITRDQIAKMIDNALLVYLKVERNEAILGFSDVSEIGPIFKEAVARTVYDEIVKGFPNEDGTFKFAPKETATRAQAAAFISRMIHTSKEFRAREIDEKEEPIPPIVEPPKPESPVIDHTSHMDIMGDSNISAKKMAEFVKVKNPNAQDIDKIAEAFIEIGNKYGVRGDIAFAQSILETGWFKFDGGTAVTPDQHNYGGLGVTSKGTKGNEFATVEEGVTAQIQHLFAYASKNELPAGEIIVDQRFDKVSPRGKAPHWEDLSMRWAMNENYGNHILSLYNQMK